MLEFAVVVPWVSQQQVEKFMTEWRISRVGSEWNVPSWLVLQQDANRDGCASTKNKGVEKAVKMGASVVVVLDDDCFPFEGGCQTLPGLFREHLKALEPQQVKMFEVVTDPPSRGTPYMEENLSVEMPVAASMGFWNEVGDYCAVRQLAYGCAPMTHRTDPIFGRYFPLCGMNLAFRPSEWNPWCQFVDVPRFDDIWMGWMWQKEAYRRGFCFNLAGPAVRHSRQSNVWKNLTQESPHLEANDSLWKTIHQNHSHDREELLKLLPRGR